MKKLLLVAVSFLLVAGFSAIALAGEMTMNGEFAFTGMTDFDVPSSYWGDTFLDLKYMPDEYNTVLFELNMKGAPGASTIDAATLKTDVGKFFDLPIGVFSAAGWTSLDPSKFEVSAHAYERTVIRYGTGATTGWFPSIVHDKFSLATAFGFSNTGVTETNDYGLLLTVPELGPAVFEAFYMVRDGGIGDGWFGADAKAGFMDDMIKVAAGFRYDIRDAVVRAAAVGTSSKYGEAWAYGFGAKFTKMPFVADVGINGVGGDVTDRTLNQIGARAGVNMDEKFGADVALGFSLSDADAESFGGVDISAWAKPGVSTWRVGYLIRDIAATWYAGCYPNGALPEGGLYIAASTKF